MAGKDFKLLLFIITALCSITWLSCETKDPECYQPVNVTLISGFMVRDTVRITDTTAGGRDTFTLNYTPRSLISPGMFTIGTDSSYAVIGSIQGASTLSVPLNPNADSIRYRILYDTANKAQADTFTFYYTASVHFISNSCGYTNYYNVDSVHYTKNVMDSAALVNPAVTNDQTGQARHVLLYFFE